MSLTRAEHGRTFDYLGGTMRQLLLWSGIGLVVAGCAGDGTGLGVSLTTVYATQTASGNTQTGVVGTTLPLPLRVVVDSAGNKLAGVRVTWRSTDGTLLPRVSVTDAAGIATVTWTLDHVAGPKTATATIPGSPQRVNFRATALAGPAAAIKKMVGDSQTVGANQASFRDLSVLIADQDGNPASAQVTWTVEHGPVAFVEPASGPSDANGISVVQLRPTGTEGAALVRAALPGGAPAVNFVLTVGPPRALVRLTSSTFVSLQNNSRNPAVDTIPVGQTVVWSLDFDYDSHRVASVGTPSFPSPGDFAYALHPTVSVRFTVAGAYQYADFYNPTATGIIVVQ